MAHFYGWVQGNRGLATRCGSKNSGLVSSTNGWNIGAKCTAVVESNRDVIHIFATSGSNGGHRDKYLGKVIQGNNSQPVFLPSGA